MNADLTDILPHRSPMVFLDELVECSCEAAVARKTFQLRDMGVDGDRVLPGALIECVAQTVAAVLDRVAADDHNATSHGMLVAVRNFRFQQPVFCGEELQLDAHVIRLLPPLCLAAGCVMRNGEPVASGELKIYFEEKDA